MMQADGFPTRDVIFCGSPGYFRELDSGMADFVDPFLERVDEVVVADRRCGALLAVWAGTGIPGPEHERFGFYTELGTRHRHTRKRVWLTAAREKAPSCATWSRTQSEGSAGAQGRRAAIH